MIPRFRLVRPTSLAEAVEAHHAAEDAAYLAGGTELLQVMKMGFARFGTLVDVKGIPELHGIARVAGGIRIGAATTHREIERSELIREAIPALAELAGRVANIRVRNTGTIGGNLAFAEPHSDPATFLVACGASVELAGPGDRRTLPIDEFVLGPLTTNRQPGEVLVGIFVPTERPRTGRAYEKLAFFERPAVSVAAELTIDDGMVSRAVLVLGSATDRPVCLSEITRALVGLSADEAAARVREAALDTLVQVDIVEDLNGSADYKRHLAAVLLERAVGAAMNDALRNGNA